LPLDGQYGDRRAKCRFSRADIDAYARTCSRVATQVTGISDATFPQTAGTGRTVGEANGQSRGTGWYSHPMLRGSQLRINSALPFQAAGSSSSDNWRMRQHQTYDC